MDLGCNFFDFDEFTDLGSILDRDVADYLDLGSMLGCDFGNSSYDFYDICDLGLTLECDFDDYLDLGSMLVLIFVICVDLGWIWW